jgi:AcrR family transcriptional regulator
MAPRDRRHDIIESVMPLLTESAAPLTTRAIAEAAGIAEGTIFRVFPDKRSLFLAVAEELVNPEGSHEELRRLLGTSRHLEPKVTATIRHLVERTQQMMVVINALREAVLSEGGPKPGPGESAGPPAFLVTANRRLLDSLTELLFEPHRDQLRVEPVKAALALRSLVFGLSHPGMDAGVSLTPETIADILLFGVVSAEEEAPCSSG